MRNYLTFKLTLLVLLVFGASSPNLAVSASSQQPPAKNVEPEQVNPGDRITVHEKSGRVLELIVEEVNTTDQIASGPDITGTYISEDSGEVFTITQTGDEISGTYGPSGKIWGTIRGNTISLDFFRTGGWTGVGEWKVNSDGSRLQGFWTSSSRNSSGKWNLTRLDPVVATRHVDPPKIKGRLVSDQSAVEVLLTDIDKIEAQLFVAASDDSTVSTTTREASPSKSSKSGDSKFGQGYSKCILGAAMYGLIPIIAGGGSEGFAVALGTTVIGTVLCAPAVGMGLSMEASMKPSVEASSRGSHTANRKTEQQRFFALARDNLVRDMARGGGEYLTAMAYLAGCPVEVHGSFARMTQRSFKQIIPQAEMDAESMFHNLQLQIAKDPLLVATCSAVS